MHILTNIARHCNACKRVQQRKVFTTPLVDEEIPSISMNQVQYRVVRWRNTEYRVGTSVYLQPGSFKLRNLFTTFYDKPEKRKVNEDIYTEFYRKMEDGIKGSHEDTPEPFCIGLITCIFVENSENCAKDIKLRVKMFYRPENVMNEIEDVLKADLNKLYWSDNECIVSFENVVGKCCVVYSNNLTVPVMKWSCEGPDRFYFTETFNSSTKTFSRPTPRGEASLLGKRIKVQITQHTVYNIFGAQIILGFKSFWFHLQIHIVFSLLMCPCGTVVSCTVQHVLAYEFLCTLSYIRITFSQSSLVICTVDPYQNMDSWCQTKPHCTTQSHIHSAGFSHAADEDYVDYMVHITGSSAYLHQCLHENGHHLPLVIKVPREVQGVIWHCWHHGVSGSRMVRPSVWMDVVAELADILHKLYGIGESQHAHHHSLFARAEHLFVQKVYDDLRNRIVPLVGGFFSICITTHGTCITKQPEELRQKQLQWLHFEHKRENFGDIQYPANSFESGMSLTGWNEAVKVLQCVNFPMSDYSSLVSWDAGTSLMAAEYDVAVRLHCAFKGIFVLTLFQEQLKVSPQSLMQGITLQDQRCTKSKHFTPLNFGAATGGNATHLCSKDISWLTASRHTIQVTRSRAAKFRKTTHATGRQLLLRLSVLLAQLADGGEHIMRLVGCQPTQPQEHCTLWALWTSSTFKNGSQCRMDVSEVKYWPDVNRKLRTLDIFAGCGGLSYGLQQSGVAEICWAIEKDMAAAEAFSRNHPHCTVLMDDCNLLLQLVMNGGIENSKRQQLPQKGEVDLICGGPPCQGFSGMNRFSEKLYSRFQNSLVASFLSYCDYYRPKFVIMENVRNFVAFKQSVVLNLTLRALLEIGYQCTFTVLQAGNFGVPQSRKRVILLAAAPGELLPSFPEATHAFSQSLCQLNAAVNGQTYYSNCNRMYSAPMRTITVRDALSDLPEIPNGHDKCEIHYKKRPLTHFQRLVRGNEKQKVQFCHMMMLRDHICKKLNPLNEARVANIPKNAGADWRDLPNIAMRLCDGSYLKELMYTNYDPRSGQMRGVCPCAEGKECDPAYKQNNTLIPWSYVHTAYDHNNWRGRFGRVNWNGFFSTITTNPDPSGIQGRVLHPKQSRIMSVREFARVQGFPDSFIFCGSIADKYRQVGNAVPPSMSAAVGYEIAKCLVIHTARQCSE
ncbi:DNA (cytosine-5)-methyltransferase 1-like [Schistocerca serialis cubense]|uniref:DNA (cytosine-5)-methyltransferase 1-like n=1 Tax=Schistocerca serialis cubense TaxID=2023355 RepID=UPI00214ED862|nr:DNA (cytosine-5)-methyltransferase 1-like [Schistocerca serialis cubense]